MNERISVQDGLCQPVVTLRPYELVSTICTLGGAQCPLMDAEEARQVLDEVKADPTLTIRLVSNADEVPHFTATADSGYTSMSETEVFNRKRDLDVLQKLGLLPGDTRRARYLYTLLLQRLESPRGLCAYATPGWEGCPLASSGAYEKVREQGWSAIVYSRPEEEAKEYRRRNVEHIHSSPRLFIRPHHLMCMACSYAGGEGRTPRPNDTLYEIRERIAEDPDVLITLVEGCCDVCDCCEGFHPATGRCVHPGGLIRDYKKDLDVFQKLGLMPGATMPARELMPLLFERVPSTTDVCGYGNGVKLSEEWSVCGGPEGNAGYQKSRKSGVF